MRKSTLLAAFSLAALLPAALSAQALTASEVMARHFRLPKAATSIVSMSMTITKNGKSLSRSLQTWASGDNSRGEVERKLIKFLAPGDIKGSGFLSLRKVDGSTESQLWLPAMGKVRRLSSGASDQDQAFFGSDFTNRDISGFTESDFAYRLLSPSAEAYLVEATPKVAMAFEKLVYTIDAKTFTAARIEYYKAGKVAKTQMMTYESVKSYLVLSSSSMVAASGSQTQIRITDPRIDVELGADTFTERFLRQ